MKWIYTDEYNCYKSIWCWFTYRWRKEVEEKKKKKETKEKLFILRAFSLCVFRNECDDSVTLALNLLFEEKKKPKPSELCELLCSIFEEEEENKVFERKTVAQTSFLKDTKKN